MTMSQVDAVMNPNEVALKIDEGSSFSEIRQHRKVMLVETFHVFARLGFDEGLAGHVTVRDPEFQDQFWVNPLGIAFKNIHIEQLLKVDHLGKVLIGDGLLNGAAFVIHSKIHQKYQHINAIAHAHSMYGKSWSSLGKLLSPITQDGCAFYQDHTLFNEFNGVVLDTNEGQSIANTLANNKAIILQNHGLLTVGSCVESAAWWFISMERCCQAQLLAEAAGTPIKIPHEVALASHKIIGSEEAAYFSFRTMI